MSLCKALLVSILVNITLLSAQESQHLLDVVTHIKHIQHIITEYISGYRKRATIRTKSDVGVKRVLFSPTSCYFITLSDESVICFWESATLTYLSSFSKKVCKVRDVCLLPHVFVTLTKDGLLWLNEMATGMDVIDPVKIERDTFMVIAAQAEHFATASPTTIALWDKVSLLCKTKFDSRQRIFTMQSDPRNTEIAFSTLLGILIWNWKRNTVRNLENIYDKTQWVQLAYSKKGKFIVALSSNALSSWNLQNGTQTKYLKNDDVQFLYFAFLPHDNHFAVLCAKQGSSESIISFRDTESFAELYTIKSHKKITHFDFSPDNRYLIAGTKDGFLEIYQNPHAFLYSLSTEATAAKQTEPTQICCCTIS